MSICFHPRKAHAALQKPKPLYHVLAPSQHALPFLPFCLLMVPENDSFAPKSFFYLSLSLCLSLSPSPFLSSSRSSNPQTRQSHCHLTSNAKNAASTVPIALKNPRSSQTYARYMRLSSTATKACTQALTVPAQVSSHAADPPPTSSSCGRKQADSPDPPSV